MSVIFFFQKVTSIASLRCISSGKDHVIATRWRRSSSDADWRNVFLQSHLINLSRSIFALVQFVYSLTSKQSPNSKKKRDLSIGDEEKIGLTSGTGNARDIIKLRVKFVILIDFFSEYDVYRILSHDARQIKAIGWIFACLSKATARLENSNLHVLWSWYFKILRSVQFLTSEESRNRILRIEGVIEIPDFIIRRLIQNLK